jgi:hypothetical protein
LIEPDVCARKDVVRDSVKASFMQIQESNYEVLLEVSSNKFLVNMVTDAAGVIQ